MIVIGIILSFVSLGFLCWLLFALAVHALPVLVAVTAGVAAYDSGAGEIGAFLVGLIAGALTLAAGQIAVAAFRLPLIRTAIAVVFAMPAGHGGLLRSPWSRAARRTCRAVAASVCADRCDCGRSHGLGAPGAPDPARSRSGAMTPVSGLHFLRRARPGTAEVSLRHVSGWVIGGCGSSNLTVSNAALATASIERHRCPQPTDPGVCNASAGADPGWLRPPFRTPGFLFLRPSRRTSCADHVCHVFSLQGCLARDPRGLLMA